MSDHGVYWNAPSSRWDTGLRWSSPGPGPTKKKTMSMIAINTGKLSIPQKQDKGATIITMSTSNPNVPGNASPLAVFVTAQARLTAAAAAAEEARQASKVRTSELNAALVLWNAAIVGLASFTEMATGGDAGKILSSGFDVRAEPTPPQPVGQVMDVRVSYNGTPGYSDVRWDREANADAYMVQCSPEPITETSWKNMGTVTEVRFSGNGATPGVRCWYRVAGVNRLGQGVWSEPALRPVM